MEKKEFYEQPDVIFCDVSEKDVITASDRDNIGNVPIEEWD